LAWQKTPFQKTNKVLTSDVISTCHLDFAHGIIAFLVSRVTSMWNMRPSQMIWTYHVKESGSFW